MRRYETIFIADPNLPEEQVASLTETFSAAITEGKGEVTKSEDWGKKKLAYEVRKQSEGHFVLLEYSCPDPTLPSELERRMRFSEPVIKFLTVRIDNDPMRLSWEKKQAEKERIRAARRAEEAAEREAREEAMLSRGPDAGPHELPDGVTPAAPREHEATSGHEVAGGHAEDEEVAE